VLFWWWNGGVIIRMARARGGGGDPRGMTIETMNYLAEASRPHRRKPPCWRGGVASQLHEQPVDVKLCHTLIDQGQTVREHSPNFYFIIFKKRRRCAAFRAQLHEQPVDETSPYILINQGRTIREHSPNFYFIEFQKKTTMRGICGNVSAAADK
jgi:hypothetical protein